jgi:hypothetical protein
MSQAMICPGVLTLGCMELSDEDSYDLLSHCNDKEACSEPCKLLTSLKFAIRRWQRRQTFINHRLPDNSKKNLNGPPSTYISIFAEKSLVNYLTFPKNPTMASKLQTPVVFIFLALYLPTIMCQLTDRFQKFYYCILLTHLFPLAWPPRANGDIFDHGTSCGSRPRNLIWARNA